MKRYLILSIIVALAVLIGFQIAKASDSRLSCAVALIFKGEPMESFLKKPGISYVQTYFRFGNELADDVIFGVDQEFIEGLNRPKYIKGGDWMAFIGLQRSGAIWIATGTDETMKGAPSKERSWKIQELGQRLQANTWYRLRCTADFATRHYVSVDIDGPGLSKHIDLSHYKLDYPNYMPFDDRAMSYYVHAMRGRSMMKEKGVPIVYFDDLEGGIIADGKETRVYFEDFEKQMEIGAQPVTSPTIKLSGYDQGRLYLERSQARFKIEKVDFARSKSHIGAADASLD